MKYKVQKLHVKRNGKMLTRYIPRAHYEGETSLEDIAEVISQVSAVSVGDVLSVLNTMSRVVGHELRQGRIISLGDFGRLRVTLRSHDVECAEAVTAECVTGYRVVFTPGGLMRTKLGTMVPLQRINSPSESFSSLSVDVD